MRSLWSLPLLLLPLACATPTHVVATVDDTIVAMPAVADDLAKADFVALGELHQTPAVHAVHLELIEALYERRGGDLVIAMEMFERDVQTVLLQYLSGNLDEDEFLAKSRPWPHYARDYRPVIRFARRHGVIVLAANAPRPLAAKVAREGLAAVAGERHVARTTTAPEDDYWEAFQVEMKGHPGVSAEMMQRFYQAQCLKDDTMAESIVEHVQRCRSAGERPLVVLICGKMHSDHRRGTVARVMSRLPGLEVRVLSAETAADVGAGKGVYASPRSVGDYVVVVPAAAEQGVVATLDDVRPSTDKPAAKPPAQPAAGAAPSDAPNPEDVRPALGLMPDYSADAKGVLVGSVREGGAADKAGIEAGDIIVAIAGVTVTDVESYTETLDAQKIGKTITVRVRRESAEVDLQVTVGSRPRTR